MKRSRRKPLSPEERERAKGRARQLREQGLCLREIGEELGAPMSTVDGWLNPRKPLPGKAKVCATCGEEFQPMRSMQKYCSHGCAARNGNSGPARRGRYVACQTCSEEFYVRPGEIGRKFCSQTCMGFQIRKERTCAICGAKFFSKPRQGPIKTCSPRCLGKFKSRAKKGSRNPGYRNGASANRERWTSQAESECRLCGSRKRLQLHHVVYEQHVRDKKGDSWEPDNSFTTCWMCHNAHHRAVDKRIPFDSLRPENVEFARALLGDAAPYYFIRYYDVDNPAEFVAGWYPMTEERG